MHGRSVLVSAVVAPSTETLGDRRDVGLQALGALAKNMQVQNRICAVDFVSAEARFSASFRCVQPFYHITPV